MSLLPDAPFSSLSETTPPLQQPPSNHQFNAVPLGHPPYMMISPPSSLGTTAFHPPPHSSIPSTSSPITPAPLYSPSFALPSSSLPSTSAGPLKRRRFSGAKIQPTRIKKVMQADEEIGRMVASVPVAIGRAMEHFAEKFLLTASSIVNKTGARTLAPHHLKLAMLATPHFAFLEPILREVGLPARAGEAYHFPQQATLPQTHSSSVQPAAASEQLQLMQQHQQQMQHALPSFMDMQSMIPSAVPPSFLPSDPSAPFLMHNPYLVGGMPQPQLPYDPLAAMGAMGQMMGGAVPNTNYAMGTSSPVTSPTTAGATRARAVRCSSSALSSGEGEGEGEGTPIKRPRGRPRKIKKEKCVEDDLVEDWSMANSRVLRAASPGDIKKESNEADRLLMPPPSLLPFKLPPSS